MNWKILGQGAIFQSSVFQPVSRGTQSFCQSPWKCSTKYNFWTFRFRQMFIWFQSFFWIEKVGNHCSLKERFCFFLSLKCCWCCCFRSVSVNIVREIVCFPSDYSNEKNTNLIGILLTSQFVWKWRHFLVHWSLCISKLIFLNTVPAALLDHE